MEKVASDTNRKGFFMQVFKGVIYATSFSLISILIFALIIKFFGMTDALIIPINQVIKVVSIFTGTFFALKECLNKGLLKGKFIGLLYTIVAYIMFSALSGTFAFNMSILNDVLFGAIIGAICGIIVVNLKK